MELGLAGLLVSPASGRPQVGFVPLIRDTEPIKHQTMGLHLCLVGVSGYRNPYLPLLSCFRMQRQRANASLPTANPTDFRHSAARAVKLINRPDHPIPQPSLLSLLHHPHLDNQPDMRQNKRFLNGLRFYLETTADNATFNNVFTYFAQVSYQSINISGSADRTVPWRQYSKDAQCCNTHHP